MPPSLRIAHPASATPRPTPSISLFRQDPPTPKNVPATPFDEAYQSLRFNARVPTAGMHSSNHCSDAVRTEIHLPSSYLIDIDAFEKIEFDDIAVREMDIPPNPDDDDELPSLNHPLQTLHNRPPSPPQFRDLGLPTMQSRRPDIFDPPSNLLGALPDVSIDNNLPLLPERGMMGRRIPARPEALNYLPGVRQPHPGRN